MTAVIGILNKKGVALAADSAVTRTRGRNRKCTKNGNKMLRLSNALPIAVMVTGNADFLRNPWDIIIRRFRQVHGHILYPTVEDCVNSFFDFIAQTDQIWEEKEETWWIKYVCSELWYSLIDKLDYIDPEQLESQKVRDRISRSIIKQLGKIRESVLKEDLSPHFKDLTAERFHEIAGGIVEKILNKNDTYLDELPQDVIENVMEDYELTLMAILTRRLKIDCAGMIFSGFGADEEYPTLIYANVAGGFDKRVNYVIRPAQDIVRISDDRPVAVCPFAQTDIADSILTGIHMNMQLPALEEFFRVEIKKQLINDKDFHGDHRDVMEILHDSFSKSMRNTIERKINQAKDKNRKKWEHHLENYDLKAMAALAESLIDLTGFQRILTFQQEGVGGPVDVAVITKNDGFTWLSRKSWYHHKDVNGEYGSLGI